MDMRKASAHSTRTGTLLSRASSGDLIAAQRLFAMQRPTLLARARIDRRLQLARKHGVEAEDVVGEVFRRAFASNLFVEFEDRGPGSLAAALGKVLDFALNDVLRRANAIKRGANVRTVSCDGGDDGETSSASAIPARDPTPTSNARVNELIELCRGHLDDREWRAWSRVELEGLDVAMVAAELGVTPSAVRGILFRARTKLMKVLDAGDNRDIR